jgi:KaiC/GvpD/RAD55 family RecA-like ATPase
VEGEVTAFDTLEQLRSDQTAAAIASGERDYATAPRWGWTDLDRITGPLLPGELWVIGSRPGNGKTSFLLSWCGQLELRGARWLYIGMEMGPEVLRRKWAAMRCNLDPDLVLANAWSQLPGDAKARITLDLEDQAAAGRANFAPGRRIDVKALREWVECAAATDCAIVVVDHFHRMGFGGDGSEWFQMAEAVRAAKELAVKHDIVIVMAAQLNRGGRDVLDAYLPPPLTALKQCGALEEESDVVAMLFRAVKRGMQRKDMNAVRDGLDDLARWIEPNVMGVVCRKHRRKGTALDRGARLYVGPTGLVESWTGGVREDE